ncbi:hypothetical protein [Acetobacter pasteurianus]|uniref:ADP-ribosylglycohydrolase n=1 Tax=Acetobacter pasteurianus NBRC 3188 TaxID=1226663 RepID=A0A401WXY6_ACEPA|nr:hypothetical protein [Acetobacter pasteurianus]GCD54181.1 ADP-ribosylglycohydrolase [Acetobacter pasteurianus NBRC 3188]
MSLLLWLKNLQKGITSLLPRSGCGLKEGILQREPVCMPVLGGVIGDYVAHPFLYTGMNSTSFIYRPEKCSPGNCSIFLLSTAISILSGLPYRDVLADWSDLLLPSPEGGGAMAGWLLRPSPIKGHGQLGMLSVAGLASSAIFECQNDAMDWVEGFCAQFTDERDIVMLIKIVTVVGLALKSGQSPKTLPRIVRSSFGIEVEDYKEIWCRGGIAVGVNPIEYVLGAISCIKDSDNYEDIVRRSVSLGGNTQLSACLAGGFAGFVFRPTEHLVSDFMEGISKGNSRIGGALCACPDSFVGNNKLHRLPICPGAVAASLEI